MIHLCRTVGIVLESIAVWEEPKYFLSLPLFNYLGSWNFLGHAGLRKTSGGFTLWPTQILPLPIPTLVVGFLIKGLNGSRISGINSNY